MHVHTAHACTHCSVQGYALAAPLLHRCHTLTDNSCAVRLCWDVTNRWLGARLDLLGAAVVLLTALLTVSIMSHYSYYVCSLVH
jgi:hypothetical protein